MSSCILKEVMYWSYFQNNFEIGKRLATFFEANIALRKRDNEKALELFSQIIKVVAVPDYYLGRSKTLMQVIEYTILFSFSSVIYFAILYHI